MVNWNLKVCGTWETVGKLCKVFKHRKVAELTR